MTTDVVDRITTVEQLSVLANGDVTYRELYIITEAGNPAVELVRFDRMFSVKPGDPDTGKPAVETFRSAVA